VFGQAKKCRELEDRLRNLGIQEKFLTTAPSEPTPSAALDIPTQIAKLAELRDQGILTNEEFEQKKTDLLNRL